MDGKDEGKEEGFSPISLLDTWSFHMWGPEKWLTDRRKPMLSVSWQMLLVVSRRSLEQNSNESSSKVLELQRTVNETSWGSPPPTSEPPAPQLQTSPASRHIPYWPCDPFLSLTRAKFSVPGVKTPNSVVLPTADGVINQIHCSRNSHSYSNNSKEDWGTGCLLSKLIDALNRFFTALVINWPTKKRSEINIWSGTKCNKTTACLLLKKMTKYDMWSFSQETEVELCIYRTFFVVLLLNILIIFQ